MQHKFKDNEDHITCLQVEQRWSPEPGSLVIFILDSLMTGGKVQLIKAGGTFTDMNNNAISRPSRK